ncbi:MAG: glycosyltransferase [Scytonematopsis contorta HA4267-MV1]|jgi:glycosyltransferase involved in cell wall biosynthesis|nr:glycosyltransferase [Scytonematopsis contorta HA4267-MV1]
MIKCSVILPVYNEEKCIEKTLKTVLYFAKSHTDYEFIFVNDGSTDAVKKIIEKQLKIAKGHNIDNLRLISYEMNRGKGFAVNTGVKYALGEYICYIDSDLAYSLEHLYIVLEKLELYDIVIGCRSLANNKSCLNKFRKIAGFIFNLLSRKVLQLHYRDMQAGMKGFKQHVAKDLFQHQQIFGFAFDVELLYIARYKKYTIGEIPAVISSHHLQKKSQVNILNDSFLMLFQLLQIKVYDTIGKYE